MRELKLVDRLNSNDLRAIMCSPGFISRLEAAVQNCEAVTPVFFVYSKDGKRSACGSVAYIPDESVDSTEPVEGAFFDEREDDAICDEGLEVVGVNVGWTLDPQGQVVIKGDLCANMLQLYVLPEGYKCSVMAVQTRPGFLKRHHFALGEDEIVPVLQGVKKTEGIVYDVEQHKWYGLDLLKDFAVEVLSKED